MFKQDSSSGKRAKYINAGSDDAFEGCFQNTAIQQLLDSHKYEK